MKQVVVSLRLHVSRIKMAQQYPGDEIIPNPEMHYNHTKQIRASPEDIFPWVLQVGKGRGGWYLPAFWERFLPSSWPAARSINPAWQNLQVGDRVADYGFSADDYFDVAYIDREKTILVYKSERMGTIFTWSLIVSRINTEMSELRLRFRGRIQRQGIGRRLLVLFGGFADWATTAPMLAGLKERAEKCHNT